MVCLAHRAVCLNCLLVLRDADPHPERELDVEPIHRQWRVEGGRLLRMSKWLIFMKVPHPEGELDGEPIHAKPPSKGEGIGLIEASDALAPGTTLA